MNNEGLRMASDIVIRSMRQDDAGDIRELDRQILGPDRSATWDTYVERFLAVADLEALIMPPWGCHVAEADGRLVSFLLSERQSTGYGLPPGARIVAIAVHPEYRRRRIGQMLVEALAKDCADAGVDQIFSVLLAKDERDAEFLASCGFSDAHVRVLSRPVG